MRPRCFSWLVPGVGSDTVGDAVALSLDREYVVTAVTILAGDRNATVDVYVGEEAMATATRCATLVEITEGETRRVNCAAKGRRVCDAQRH